MRAYADHVSGTKVRYVYPCGHSEIVDHGKGPASKRLGEMGVRMMARYWGAQAGGVTVRDDACKICR